MPPEWMPRCLGSRCILAASSLTAAGAPPGSASPSVAGLQGSGPISRAQASASAGANPSARPASRSAIRGRYEITLATWAARFRP